jgi:hypothetical protein
MSFVRLLVPICCSFVASRLAAAPVPIAMQSNVVIRIAASNLSSGSSQN